MNPRPSSSPVPGDGERTALAQLRWWAGHAEFIRRDHLFAEIDRLAALAAASPSSPEPGVIDVAGRCPSCGFNTLFVGSAGHLTCSWAECKDPCAADTALAGPPSPPQEGEGLTIIEVPMDGVRVGDEVWVTAARDAVEGEWVKASAWDETGTPFSGTSLALEGRSPIVYPNRTVIVRRAAPASPETEPRRRSSWATDDPWTFGGAHTSYSKAEADDRFRALEVAGRMSSEGIDEPSTLYNLDEAGWLLVRRSDLPAPAEPSEGETDGAFELERERSGRAQTLGAPLVPGVNVDPVDIARGLAELKLIGYDEPKTVTVITYALQRWARGEEEKAEKGAIDRTFHGIDFTSWRRVLAAAVTTPAPINKEGN